ncbi:MAG TPA: phosphatidylglycerophosphatase A [Rhizomicrobium sp.]|jgi:phosphatidylglycerophosphatase A|nr:phosphatidylglycerophosphatase A [Rhizomicrobium sp.]
MEETANFKLAAQLATVFGVGRSPTAPGTAGSLVALPVAWLLAIWGGRFTLLLAAILVLAIGSWACEIYVRATGKEDPSECVIDEVAGQWIVCAFVPIAVPFWHSILDYCLAFILFRLFDILKPWPINWVERNTPGGLGVMLDDVVAGLMACVIIVALAQFGLI